MAISLIRQERTTLDTTSFSSKNPKLGPGTYNTNSDKWGTNPGTGVPFLSLSERKIDGGTGTTTASVLATPGPGQYYNPNGTIVGNNNHITIGAPDSHGVNRGPQFYSTSKRFAPLAPGSTEYCESTVMITPGPGRYSQPEGNTVKTFSRLERENKKRELMKKYNQGSGGNNGNTKGSGALSLIAAVTNQPTAPSVPNQYTQREEILREKLALIEEQEKEQQQKGQQAVNKIPSKIKGVDFHSSTVQRGGGGGGSGRGGGGGSGQVSGQSGVPVTTDLALTVKKTNSSGGSSSTGEQRPGPGTYEPQKNEGFDAAFLEAQDKSQLRETSQFKSKVKLPYQKDPNSTIQSQTPGPGHFHQVHKNPKSMIEKPNDHYQFGSKSKREGWNRNLDQPYSQPFSDLVPGPGQYGCDAKTKLRQGQAPNLSSTQVTHQDSIPGIGSGGVTSGLGGFLQSVRQRYRGIHNPSTISSLEEMKGIPLQAFNSSDVRPCNRELSDPSGSGGGQSGHNQVPPPTRYFADVINKLDRGISYTVQQKANIGKKGVFGSSMQDRFFRSALHSWAPEGCEPGGYDPKLPGAQDEGQESSMFKSSSSRFKHEREELAALGIGQQAQQDNQDQLGDGQNQPSTSQTQTVGSTSQNKKTNIGSTRPGKTKHQTSSQSDSLGPEYYIDEHGMRRRRPLPNPSPGPWSYNPKLDPNYKSPFRTPDTQNVSFGTSKGRDRFAGPSSTTGSGGVGPGPAAYSVSSVKSIAESTKPIYAQRTVTRSLAGSGNVGGNGVPGPGTYDLNSSNGTNCSLLKRSYNVTQNSGPMMRGPMFV